MKHVTIYKDSSSYVAFPSVTRLENGEILVSFREASQFSADIASSGGHTHLDTQTHVCLVRSTDNGETWDPSTKTVVYDEGLDTGVALTALSDGVIVAALYNMWQLVPRERRQEIEGPIFRHSSDLNLIGRPLGCATRRSYDGGHTWSDELQWAKFDAAVGSIYDSRTGVAELPDGTLIWLVCDGDMMRSERVWLVHSWDRGDTWSDPRLVAADPAGDRAYYGTISFAEPHLLSLGDGRVIAMLRTEPSDSPAEGRMYQTMSRDWGMTWRPFTRTPIWGHPPHLLHLQSGAILCTYGHRRPPFGIRACLSHDDGETWDVQNEIILRDDGLGVDLGYPYSIQLPDGNILTVYYIYGEDSIRHIAGTFWSENK